MKKPQVEEKLRNRGLPSINEARAQRSKINWMPPKFWVWAAVILGASFIYWWKKEAGEIEEMRGSVLSRQRGVVDELGPRWFPLRDKIEAWTMECANPPEAEGDEEVIATAVLRNWDFRGLPGIYLRLGSAQTESAEAIRKAAQGSLHDGFTACFMVVDNPNPLAGPECKTTKDCPTGQHCNEFDHCADYSQPFNLRLAYRTMRVMTDDWVEQVQRTTSKLIMRGAVMSFDVINQYDIPIAVELLTKAKYFLVVVDDSSKAEGQPPTPKEEDAGMGANWAIPTAPHKARVCAWRLEDDRKVLSVERQAGGELVGGGAADEETRRSRQRQANSCSLALAVRQSIGDDSVPNLP